MNTGFTPIIYLVFPFIAAADSMGTAGNQYLMITAIGALTGTIVYLHKSNQKAAMEAAAALAKATAEKDKRDDERFKEFVEHHEQAIDKLNVERDAMTLERIKRIEMLMGLIKDTAVAMNNQASSGNQQAMAISELRVVLSEAVRLLHTSNVKTHDVNVINKGEGQKIPVEPIVSNKI